MMELPRRIDSLDDVEENYREAYKEHDGGYFVLQLKGDDADVEAKLKTFRESNIELRKQQEEMQKQLNALKDIDPKEFKKGQDALKRLNKLGEKKLIDEGKIDEVVESRVSAMRDDYKQQLELKDEALKNATERAEVFQKQLGSATRRDKIRQAVDKVGKVRQGAITDIDYRAERDWQVAEDGTIKAERNGKPLYDSDGNELSPERWAHDLLTTAPYLFEGGGGGGAEGGKKGKPTPGKKIIDRDPVEFGKHLEDIAKGKTEVAEP